MFINRYFELYLKIEKMTNNLTAAEEYDTLQEVINWALKQILPAAETTGFWQRVKKI